MNNDFFKMPEKIFGISSSLVRLFLLPLAVFLVFLTSLSLVVIPRIDSIKSLWASISKIKSEIKLTDSKRIYLSSVDQNELIKNQEYLSSAVLQEKNSYLLVGVIRNISEDFGFRVKSFLINPMSIKDSLESLKVSSENVATKLPINLTLEGPKDKMVDLLISIENSLPIMFIDKIGIIGKQETAEINLVISSYYVPDNENLVSGNLTLNDLIPTKEENDLLSTISKFNKDESLTKSLIDQSLQGKSYVDYVRDDPFSP